MKPKQYYTIGRLTLATREGAWENEVELRTVRARRHAPKHFFSSVFRSHHHPVSLREPRTFPASRAVYVSNTVLVLMVMLVLVLALLMLRLVLTLVLMLVRVLLMLICSW